MRRAASPGAIGTQAAIDDGDTVRNTGTELSSWDRTGNATGSTTGKALSVAEAVQMQTLILLLR